MYMYNYSITLLKNACVLSYLINLTYFVQLYGKKSFAKCLKI